jgi:DNA transposition AAA+ family ATPase
MDYQKLDTLTLENLALTYPEELRERFVWLGCYLREECGRDVNRLSERAQKLGFAMDTTTWGRIMRGRLCVDADGNRTETPLVSIPKLIRTIDALRNDARIKARGGRIPFQMTTTTQSIFDYIDMKRAPDRVCKFGVIIGETGSQKSASYTEYCLQNNHAMCVRVEAPATPTMKRFVYDLAEKYGCARSASYTRAVDLIINTANDRRCIIVDNVQRLYVTKREADQPIFNFLQKLQEDSGCCIIMSFTPTFERVFTTGLNKGFFEQFEGRCGGRKKFLRLPAYPPEEDVLIIAKAFKLVDAEKHADYLVAIGHEEGRIRRLFDDLQDARILAERRKQPMTIGHVRAARGEE